MIPLLLLALLVDPPATCTMAGTVVDSVTGEAIARAALFLEPMDRTKRHTATTMSGEDGGFRMVEIEPGQYRLRTRRSGYLEGAYGARSRGWQGAVLTLEPGQKLELEHKLVRSAAVSGVVRNREGEPVEHAHVVLARRTSEYGKARVEGVESADTDDRGQYRLHSVAPGKYYLMVELRQQEWDTVDHSPEGSRRAELDVATWYPGAPDPSGASALAVGAGARLEGIDMTLLRRRGFRVTGRVVNLPAGPRPGLTLTSPGQDDAGDLEPHTTIKNAAGEFEFRNVPPGSYLLTGGRASATVTVAGTDVEGVRLEFGAAAAVRGRITVEGDAAGARFPEVFLTYDGRRGTMLMVRPDLTFEADYVEPRRYEVRVGQSEPRRLYVKSIRSGEKDALGDGLAVGGGTVPIEIVMAADGARVEGVVTNADGRPLLGATVLLAPPEGLRGRSDLYRSATTDPFGRYALEPAAPGEYRLFVWEDVEEGAWHDPEFLREHEKRAERVVLAARETRTVALQVE